MDSDMENMDKTNEIKHPSAVPAATETENADMIKIDKNILILWRDRLYLTEMKLINAANILSVIQGIESFLRK